MVGPAAGLGSAPPLVLTRQRMKDHNFERVP
jgi:hypothetical protein